MVTLGKQVRAQLPGDHEIIGHASRLDDSAPCWWWTPRPTSTW